MAVPPAPDDHAGLTSSDHHDRTAADPAPSRAPASRFRVVLLAVLVVALLASAGVVVWLLADRRGEADETQAEREAVLSQARQFMLRGQTYGPDQLEEGKLPEYRELVEEVVTPKLATEFEQTVAVAEQLVAESGIGRSAEVFGVGVESLDEDSATALVTGQITSTYPGKKKDQRRTAGTDLFRVVVELVKVDGDWLVDEFEPVTQPDGGTAP